jgi:hypothetical protein
LKKGDLGGFKNHQWEGIFGTRDKFPVAQAFQPVQAQAKACGYILPEALLTTG